LTEAIHFGNDFNSSVASLRTLDAFLRNWWCLSIGITGGLRRNTQSTNIWRKDTFEKVQNAIGDRRLATMSPEDYERAKRYLDKLERNENQS
jgi:hypothetical protein